MREAFDRVLTARAGRAALRRRRGPRRRRARHHARPPERAPGRSTPGGTASPTSSSRRSSPPRPGPSATATASRRGPATPPTPWPSTATSPTGDLSRTGACSPTTRSAGWRTPAPPTTPVDTIEPGIDPVTGEPCPASSTSTTRPRSTATARSRCRAGNLDTADNVAVVVPGLRHRRRERAVPGRTGPDPLRVEPVPRHRPDQRVDVLDRVRRPRQPALGRGLGRRRRGRRGPRRPAAATGWPTPSTACAPPATATPPT